MVIRPLCEAPLCADLECLAVDKPNLLYISPVMPALTGNGLAMRAGIMLQALAADYNVYLQVIPIVQGAAEENAHTSLTKWCADFAVHRVADRVDPLFRLIARIKHSRQRLAASASYPRPVLCRFATTSSIREAAQVFRGVPFREVHVFRLYMAPFAEPYLQGAPEDRPTCRLDLDDYESLTRRRLAALYEAVGNEASASIERSEAEKYAVMELRYLPLFDRVYVCSDHDRVEIARRHGCGNIAVIPNAVHAQATAGARHGSVPFTLLFVGSLGYYPNEDAALFLCSEVLPRIRGRAKRTFRAIIVGSHPSGRVLGLSANPEVTVTGAVSDLAEYYRDADVVVIPVRAGGGTRIKMLEAFSYRRPVVSTALGAEGIDVRHGTHLLIADTPKEFAEQCLRLMENPAVGQELADCAFEFVKVNHSPERIRQLLRRDHRSD